MRAAECEITSEKVKHFFPHWLFATLRSGICRHVFREDRAQKIGPAGCKLDATAYRLREVAQCKKCFLVLNHPDPCQVEGWSVALGVQVVSAFNGGICRGCQLKV